ncbi:MAG TPA: hypothetical protein VK752_32635 [Bryobacteraceae bacterium]|jgi:hypothetical protein|nr:hypothetical protein [Bryobacteraceae bacterium]
MPRRRTLLRLTALLAIVSSYGYQQPEDEKESYIVYATVLRIWEPQVATWAIVRQTRNIKLCLLPANPNQESLYRDVFDNDREKNRAKLALERKFDLPDYALVEPEAWGRSSQSRSFAVFSAVGFNASRTYAAVCLWAGATRPRLAHCAWAA